MTSTRSLPKSCAVSWATASAPGSSEKNVTWKSFGVDGPSPIGLRSITSASSSRVRTTVAASTPNSSRTSFEISRSSVAGCLALVSRMLPLCTRVATSSWPAASRTSRSRGIATRLREPRLIPRRSAICRAMAGHGTVPPVLDPGVLAFARGALPPPPARVLEIGAGDGELAAALREGGHEVTAIDPDADPATGVERIPLLEVQGRYDAAVAVVSLHHVEPLAESSEHLAELIEPGGVVAIDELDVDRYDERVTAWWLHQRAAAGHEERHDAQSILE